MSYSLLSVIYKKGQAIFRHSCISIPLINFELMYEFSSNLTLKVAHKFFGSMAKFNNSSKSKFYL
jgi:hypothetical protein